MKVVFHIIRGYLALGLLLYAPIGFSEALPEYRLKAAFLYNFVAFTEWTNDVEEIINLCVYGKTRLREEIETLNGRRLNEYQLLIKVDKAANDLKDCQVIYISDAAIHNLTYIRSRINNQPILTISDSKNAARQGVMINMDIEKGKIVFEINLKAARHVGLNISSQLLRLAKEVYQ